jgi:transposase
MESNELKLRHEQFLNFHSLLSVAYFEQKIELIDYKQKANYWESQFNKSKGKESELQEKIAELKGQLRKREQQLFGRKSERTCKSQKEKRESSKNRGQQKGGKGHGRRNYDNLPAVEETIDFIDTDKCCPCCGLEYKPLNATEDSEVLEVINVKAYKRIIKRGKYKRCCNCKVKSLPKIITAPAIDRLLPKSKIGVSIWASLLLQKHEYQQPLYRVLKQWESNGLSLAMGTVTDGLKKIMPLLSPVYDGIVKHNIGAKHWHADETGWKVFESVEGKHSNRWYLWIFANSESVVFKLDQSRSSQVLRDHFGESASGTLNVDRYVAYKAIAKQGVFTLAFCWAHVRRDFLSYAKFKPDLEDWAFSWINSIGKLYEFNNKRIKNIPGTEEYKKNNACLRKELDEFQKRITEQLSDDSLLNSAKKLLESLKNHWEGLTVFIDRPEIPMDNNTAERGLRNSVIGRKNYYGSSAVWSGELAAIMFTIFETIKRWKLNPHTWLIAYLQQCAFNGKAPKSIKDFLPWNMTEQQKILFAKPPVGENTS